MGNTDAFSALVGGLVTLLPTVVAAWALIRKNRSQDKKELRKDTIDEMQTLINQIKINSLEEVQRQNNKIETLETKLAGIDEKLTACRSEHAESLGHILYLEHMMRKSRIKFRTWGEIHGSGDKEDKEDKEGKEGKESKGEEVDDS